MDWTLAGQFWIIAAALAVTPGADWAFVISAGVRRQHAAPAVLGLLSGYVVVIALVAVGAGAAVTAFPAALTALTVAGGAFLVFLGVSALRAPAAPLDLTGEPLASGGLQQYLRGAGVSGINPKGIMLLLALLPQFTGPAGAWPEPMQMLALGGLHLLNCAIVYSVVAALSGRVLGGRPRAGAIVSRITGVMMIAVGLLLLAEQIAPLL